MTFSIMALSRMTFGGMTLGRKTFSIMSLVRIMQFVILHSVERHSPERQTIE